MGAPRFPHVKVKLSDEDGNAFAILARTKKALRRGNVSDQEINAFVSEATRGDYDHLLQTVMATVETE